MENEQDPREQYDNWIADENSAESDGEVKQKVAERFAQPFSSRLSEYITGMKPEDPRILERLSTDQKIVRAKYNLPNPHQPPAEFERSLMQIAKNLNVQIKSKSECGKFFEENEFAGAVHFDEGKIGIDINRTELQKYRNSLNTLEHELVHAIQGRKSPSMPIELMEYEAYVSNANIEYLVKDREAINEIFFNFFVGASVNIHYQLLSKERGEKVLPIWNNPEYFLRKDGIDPKIIETHNKPEPEDQA